MNEQFNPYNYNESFNPNPPQHKPIWASVTSFVLGIVNICLCCCTTYIFAPLSLIFGIIALSKKWGGKGLAIAGVMLSTLSLIFVIATNIIFKEANDDITKFIMNADKYVQEYEETEEVPEDFKKYCDPKYDSVWKSMGYDSFDDFYKDYMKGFTEKYYSRKGNTGNNDTDSNDFLDNAGEKPVDL